MAYYLDPANPTLWVLIALILFLSLLVYMGVPGLVGRMLDDRTRRIAQELEDARQLRDDAQALLAEYQRKQRDAEAEVEDIVKRAKTEAERMASETRAAMEAALARRVLQADDKIAQAEAKAMAEVRGVAADIAVEAAHKLLAARFDAKTDADLVDKQIEEVGARLH